MRCKMFHPKIRSILICVALGLLTRHGLADNSQEHLTTDAKTQNDTQINEADAGPDENHRAEAIEGNNSADSPAVEAYDSTDVPATPAVEDYNSTDTPAVEGHNSTDLDEEYREAVERFKENPTAYWKNLSATATNTLTSLWRDQVTHLNGIEEEKTVVFQTYKVELKKITYLVEKTNELVKKQCNAIPKLNWTEIDEEGAQPYHDDVIGKLAKNWDEIERYFKENKLRGVDVSVKRINKLIPTVKEELSNCWDQLKKLRLEIKYFMRFCKEHAVPF